MIALIGQVLSLVLLLLGKWFEFTSEQKKKAKEIMKEVKNAKDPSTITAMFDAINRL
jgi:preprotein translocase subunit YajC